MQITITTHDDRIFTVDLDPNDPIETLQAVVEAETGLTAAQQRLIHNGRELPTGGQTLGGAGISANDLVMLVPRVAAPAAGPRAAAAAAPSDAGNPAAMHPDGSAVNPELLMSMLEGNPGQLEGLPQALQRAVRSKDVAGFQGELRKLSAERRKAAEDEQRFQRLSEEDPFNPEVQRRLMEAVEAANVTENFEQALEHNPEAFSSVCMLYVNMEVNGFPLKAFIDSGAQMTIMSKSCAERCNLLRLMDRRWQGTAVGVGSAKILGRIHMSQLKAGDHFFPCSITVLDQDGMEFLFGLENLKRHQCSIDLKEGVLRFGTTGSALPFLSEHEIPQQEHKLLEGGDSAAAAGGSGSGGAAPPPAAPAPAAPSAPPAAAAPGGGGLPAGWEDKVTQLQGLGFPPEQCLAALRNVNGDVEQAAALLFGGF